MMSSSEIARVVWKAIRQTVLQNELWYGEENHRLLCKVLRRFAGDLGSEELRRAIDSYERLPAEKRRAAWEVSRSQ